MSTFCVLQLILFGAKQTINRHVSVDKGAVETKGLKNEFRGLSCWFSG